MFRGGETTWLQHPRRQIRHQRRLTNGKARNGPAPRRAPRKTAAISADDIKHLPKAPAGYRDIARKLADAMERTRFRSPISSAKLRSLVKRSEALAKHAAMLELKATAADQARMVHESQAWKSMLSVWRLVQAATPDRPELEQPVAFMQEYMGVGRSTPATTPPAQSPAS